MEVPVISVWEAPPQMDIGAPQPVTKVLHDSLLVAYRTARGDHFAVVRFSGVQAWSWESPTDENVGAHPLWADGVALCTWLEVREPTATGRDLRRWVATFHDDTLVVTARAAAVLVRAIQARDAESALSMLRCDRRRSDWTEPSYRVD